MKLYRAFLFTHHVKLRVKVIIGKCVYEKICVVEAKPCNNYLLSIQTLSGPSPSLILAVVTVIRNILDIGNGIDFRVAYVYHI